MKHLRRTALLLPAVLLLLSTAPAGASFLRALVAEVPDGVTLVVVNSNRKLTVVLKGVQPPRDEREAEQARRHLAALALGREVTVEYTGLRGGHIYGRALCGGMDLGLQLVRDGAARYDAATDNALGEAERQLYAETERAARAERRGVWQEARGPAAVAAVAPVAPVQLALPANVSVAPPSERPARRSLSTEDLIVRRAAASPGKGSKSGGPATPKQARWPLNRPGEEFDFSRHLGQGRTTIVYFYADWCPACREVSPMMKGINSNTPDVEVLALNIDHWGSPVAAAHGVNFVPYFQIYDESGYLVAEGKQAAQWLAQEAARRAREGG
ncbi:MAG TPA: thioredoxin domain-containing protein [Pyrinomonadaceae bacterium]|nr:thioredoxin domain-containing protein [Pyrinomonadaceae bacterium]